MSLHIFAHNLRNLMKALGIKQEAFAKRCEITPAALSQLLNGKREPQLSTLLKIHSATGCCLNKLVGVK